MRPRINKFQQRELRREGMRKFITGTDFRDENALRIIFQFRRAFGLLHEAYAVENLSTESIVDIIKEHGFTNSLTAPPLHENMKGATWFTDFNDRRDTALVALASTPEANGYFSKRVFVFASSSFGFDFENMRARLTQGNQK